MLKELNTKLLEQCKGDRTIFVLKGFNTCLKDLEMNVDRIFDLHLEKELLNIGQKEIQNILIELQKLSTGNSYYCLYEEIVFVEKNNLIGFISANNYKIKVIDIGCFDYLYPGFCFDDIQRYVKEYNKDSDNSNYMQIFYTEFFVRDRLSIVSYNLLELEDLCTYVNLIDIYTEEYYYKKYDKELVFELQDNASPEIFIKLFADILDGKYNRILYKQIENKDVPKLKKYYIYTICWVLTYKLLEQRKSRRNLICILTIWKF